MRSYSMAPVESNDPYWSAVTDVSCPTGCGGIVRWAEAGYAPGYRICDGCKKHFLASGNVSSPSLIRFTR